MSEVVTATPGHEHAAGQERAVSALVLRLCAGLDAENIGYCHWKSNTTVDRAVRGAEDLDLLVRRAQATAFVEVLSRLGFKEARSPAARELPGVAHYYGYDEAADCLVHVHAHSQLIVGDDMTKSCRLPIEDVVIDTAIRRGPILISAPEMELILFVIRMMLKYRVWDGVLRGQSRIPARARAELDDLEGRADAARVHALLRAHLPFIEAGLFDRCLASLRHGAPLAPAVRLGRRLQAALRSQARLPSALDLWLKNWRRARLAVQWMVGRRPRKRLTGGGALIAIVGGDGSGKSTAVRELSRWLSANFATLTVHMGKPPEGPVSLAVGAAAQVVRWRRARRTGHALNSRNGHVPFPGYLWLLRRVFLARSRYRAYVRARRFATNGGLVVCDRYPVPEIMLMDGPQATHFATAVDAGRAIRFLARLEQSYYAHVMPPDLLVVLRLDPEIAVRRKPAEPAAFVRARNREVAEVAWERRPVSILDASLPREDVLARLKTLVWSSV